MKAPNVPLVLPLIGWGIMAALWCSESSRRGGCYMTEYLTAERLNDTLDLILLGSSWAESLTKIVGLVAAGKWGYSGLRYGVAWALALIVVGYRRLNPPADPLLVEMLSALETSEIAYEARERIGTLLAGPVAVTVLAEKAAIIGDKHEILGHREPGEIWNAHLAGQAVTEGMLGTRGWRRLQATVRRVVAHWQALDAANAQDAAEARLNLQRLEALEAARKVRESKRQG